MKPDDKRAAKAAYKERKAAPGIYAVRCTPTGQVWVGATPELTAVPNRLWFALRLGNHPDAGLTAAWKAHGAEGCVFKELERIEPEDDPYLRHAALKERLAHWQEKLAAPNLP